MFWTFGPKPSKTTWGFGTIRYRPLKSRWSWGPLSQAVVGSVLEAACTPDTGIPPRSISMTGSGPGGCECLLALPPPYGWANYHTLQTSHLFTRLSSTGLLPSSTVPHPTVESCRYVGSGPGTGVLTVCLVSLVQNTIRMYKNCTFIIAL